MTVAAIGAAAGLLMLLATGSVYAAYDQARGAIKSIDAAAGTLVVAVRANRNDEPKDTTFKVDKEAGILINGEKKTLADLTVGANASITFKEGEPPVAVLISVFNRPGGGGPGGGGNRRGGGGGGAGGGAGGGGGN
jgi:uncharacterized membrane protein YgcG